VGFTPRRIDDLMRPRPWDRPRLEVGLAIGLLVLYGSMLLGTFTLMALGIRWLWIHS
jgi:hypothetical protein